MKNKSAILALIIGNTVFLLGEFLLYKRISGLYLGSILGGVLLVGYKKIPFLDFFFRWMLISNFCILVVNLFFREFLLIPPLFSSGDNVFEQDIIRNISFGSFSIKLRRSTGIIDNIHVSTLLLLYLVFIFYVKKKKTLFWLTSGVFLLTLNFQFILVYVLFFMMLKFKAFFIENKSLLFLFIPVLFILIDFVFLEQAYFHQISNSKFDLLFFELRYYYDFLDFGSLLYGIKPYMIEDPYDSQAGFYVPLTDIGLIGVPIQFGMLGVLSIFISILVGFNFFSGRFKLLYKLLLITIIHYFSLASFIALLSTFWLSQYYLKIEKK